MCKILDDLKNFSLGGIGFSENHPNADCMGPQNCDRRVFSWNFFYKLQLSQ